jgi:hypothetical protein
MAMPGSGPARPFYRAAKQRVDDALLLLEMERTTAVVYLAGYSVECMLKALILSAVPQAQEAELLGMFRGARAHTTMNGCCTCIRKKVGPGCPRLSSHTLPVSTPGRQTCGMPLGP